MPEPIDFDAPLLRLAWQFKAQALARETAAMLALTKAWAEAWRRIARNLAALTSEIESNRSSGITVSNGLLYRRDRAEELLNQIRSELARLTADADREIRRAQRDEVESALEDAPRLAGAATGNAEVARRLAERWTAVPTDAAEMLTGTLQQGSPLNALLAELGTATQVGIAEHLTSGLIAGRNPRAIARGIRDDWGTSLNRALRISRTEILRSYRAANLYQYQQNNHIIKGWRWVASFSDRTCIACLMQHGKVYPVTTPMASHVQCRCTPAPVTLSWRELGFDIDEPEPPIREGDGWRWFTAQPAATQRHILGDPVYNAWRQGVITPAQFWHVDHDPVWGDAIVASSLRRAMTRPR